MRLARLFEGLYGQDDFGNCPLCYQHGDFRPDVSEFHAAHEEAEKYAFAKTRIEKYDRDAWFRYFKEAMRQHGYLREGGTWVMQKYLATESIDEKDEFVAKFPIFCCIDLGGMTATAEQARDISLLLGGDGTIQHADEENGCFELTMSAELSQKLETNGYLEEKVKFGGRWATVTAEMP